MKTADQIVERIKEINAEANLFDFQPDTLMEFLTFEQAKPFLKDEATADKWGDVTPLTEADVLNKMREYMNEYGIDKAENHRGLSAGRTIDRFRAWLWLLGDDELLAFADEDRNYKNYGAPILMRICKKYELASEFSEEFINMAAGKPCVPDCDSGCGR